MENKEEIREQGYVPRPAWQVWAARLGVVMAVLLVIYEIYALAQGGR